MSIITRFAPSPTGLLHVGNVRTALINWLFAKRHGGKFILRIDDTDPVRSKAEYEIAIKEDLIWLGLSWDEYRNQSSKLSRYNEAKQLLIKSGRLYPCYETAEEIDIKRKIQLQRGLPPIYDRASMKLTEGQIQKYQDEGKKPHYRFLLKGDPIVWNDMIRGEINFSGANLSDPILIREDGSMTYMICSVVDDIDYNISHVIRGEDHISNTAIGIQLCQALGGVTPQFGHTSLIVAKDQEISKRLGGFDIRSFRNDFVEPMAINSFLATLGSSKPAEAHQTLEELIADFDLNAFGCAPTNYDFQDLLRTNKKIVAHLSYDEIKGRLVELGIEVSADFWNIARENISKLNEVKDWQDICHKQVKPCIVADNKDFLDYIATLLPQGDWDGETWSVWINKIKVAYPDRRGPSLFMPIRQALTGKESGPELKDLLPFIGREKVIGRLNGANI